MLIKHSSELNDIANIIANEIKDNCCGGDIIEVTDLGYDLNGLESLLSALIESQGVGVAEIVCKGSKTVYIAIKSVRGQSSVPSVDVDRWREPILEALRDYGVAIPVEGIMKECDLSKPQAHALLSALVDEGSVLREKEVTRKRGRPSYLYSIAE